MPIVHNLISGLAWSSISSSPSIGTQHSIQHANNLKCSQVITMVIPITNPTKSFWIEEANSPLRNYRSTEDLPKETNIVIIGSGYTGATTAYWVNKVRGQFGGLL